MLKTDDYSKWKAMAKVARERLAARRVMNIDIDAETHMIIGTNGAGRKTLNKPPANTKYENIALPIREKLEKDGITISIDKLPRSTLSIVTLSDGKKEIITPAMPEKDAIIFGGTVWYG